MKAIVNNGYGPPESLELREIEMPEVGDDDLLVSVRAASVNPYDWHVLRGEPYIVRLIEGLRRPRQRRVGIDAAGVVEAVGANVTGFAAGDEVFGGRVGAFAEYVSGPAERFAPKPPQLSFEQAASIPIAGVTALQGMRKAELQAGHRLVINGAAGGVGTFAVQIAKSLGADVTGVCSTANVDLVRSIGADHVVDYTREDFTAERDAYDAILDVVGNRSSSDLRRTLRPHGVLVGVGGQRGGKVLGPVPALLYSLVRGKVGTQRLRPLLANINAADLTELADLCAAGTVTPVIDRTYPLGETAEAVRYLETLHARGKVLVLP